MEITKMIRFGVIASVTLGLAPFNPPHIIGKLQWVLGGGKGMQAMDYFDLLLHGLPWVLLFVSTGIYLGMKIRGLSAEKS